MNNVCGKMELVRRYAGNRASREESVEAERHLYEEKCPDCCPLVERLWERGADPGTEFMELPAPANGAAIPELLGGRYRLARELGEGTFGRVFLARDERTQTHVAVKVAKQSGRQVFPAHEEYGKIAQLNHPNIVKALDRGADGGVTYVVFEYIDGKPLDSVIEGGVPDLNRSLRWMAQLADAVWEAHKNGIYHFDLKPSNVLIEASSGRPCLADFGVAAHRDARHKNRGAGTALYMSPEQLRGEGVDGRSDVWGLGVIFYQLLTGKLPFGGAEEIGSAEPLPPQELRPALPSDVSRVCLKCLGREPRHRYQTAGELREAVRRAQHRLNYRPSVWFSMAMAVPAVAILIALALVLAHFNRKPPTWRYVRELPERVARDQWLALAVTPAEPVRVTRDCRVQEGGKLRLEGAGTLTFAPGTRITNNGTLQVSGDIARGGLTLLRQNPDEPWDLGGTVTPGTELTNAHFVHRVSRLPRRVQAHDSVVVRVSKDAPLDVTETCEVAAGGELRIEGAGAVRFAGQAGINSGGRLTVTGDGENGGLTFLGREPGQLWGGVQLWGEGARGSEITDARLVGAGGARYHWPNPRFSRSKTSYVAPEVKSSTKAARIGGALLILHTDDVVLERVEFVRNSSERGGAVCVCDVADVRFHDCLFLGNEAKGTTRSPGGAVYTCNARNVRFQRCRFVKNRATDRNSCGGAIYGGFNSHLVLHHSTFEQNFGGLVGGAIYLLSVKPEAVKDFDYKYAFTEVTGCRFADNYAAFWGSLAAAGRGASIYANDGVALTVQDTVFTQTWPCQSLVEVEGRQDNPCRFVARDCEFRVNREAAGLADVCVAGKEWDHRDIDAASVRVTRVPGAFRDDWLAKGFEEPAGPRAVDTVVIHHASALGWDTANDRYINPAVRELFYRENPRLGVISPQERAFAPEMVKAVFGAYGVGAHYLIDRDGNIVRLVPEDKVAHHAGKSRMPRRFDPDEREGVNQFSIGIELIGTHPDDDPRVGEELGFDVSLEGPIPAYTYAQYYALRWLLDDIARRHELRYVVGHDEIALKKDGSYGRKKDPGASFQWSIIRDGQTGAPK